MSVHSLNLREVPTAHVAAATLGARARRAGLPVELTAVPRETTLLRYALDLPDGSAEILVAPQPLAQACWPELAGLAWDVMAERDQPGLFTAMGQPLARMSVFSGTPQVRWLGSTRTASAPLSKPTLVTDWGCCWLERWETTATRLQALPSSVADFPLPLELELARVRLKPTRLLRLVPGDVIVLEDITARVCVGGRGLYRFVLNEDYIMMDESLSDVPFEGLTTSSAMAMPETTGSPSADPVPERFDVTDLPVAVRVLFPPLELSVQDLADLAVGSTLPLPAGVEAAVQLQVNGRCFAVGELVRVGETLGVSLTAVGQR
jgi:type III secretion protein Q